HADALDGGVIVVEFGEQGGIVGVVAAPRHVRLGIHVPVLAVDETFQADQRDRVAQCERPARKPDGGVVVLFGGDVVDDEAQAQGSIAHAGCSSRGSGSGWGWWSRATSTSRQRSSTSAKPSALA